MKLKKRSEFPENELWDLTALYKDRQDFLLAIEKALEDIKVFKKITRENLIMLRILLVPLWKSSIFISR